MSNQAEINRAKPWQMALFVLNNTATNTFLVLMTFVSYYAVGAAGIGVVAVSVILTWMRMFDGITDPLIGFLIDKTNTKFGKFRPAMVLGYVVMTITTYILFTSTHLVAQEYRLLFFGLIYSLYIIGYTFQTACTKAGQVCLTNDPKQRPTFSLYDGIYNSILFAFLPAYVLNSLVPKYTTDTVNGLNSPAMHLELLITVLIIAGVLTILAVIGISQKDNPKYFGSPTNGRPLRFRDYWDVLKNNKAIQMLIVAASTDKLASSTAGNAAVGMIVFGIASGNPKIQGEIAAYTTIPVLVILFFGIRLASKFGQMTAFKIFTWASIAICSVLGGMIIFGPMTTLNVQNLGAFTLLFMVIFIIMKGVMGIATSIVIPMIADCADYETYRTGRYIPGMMGTLFSLVDKLISAFATSVVGFTLALIGFKTQLPTMGTPLSPELLYTGVFLFVGMPILGFICSLVAMKFYPLTKDKMVEIQDEIQKIKARTLEQQKEGIDDSPMIAIQKRS